MPMGRGSLDRSVDALVMQGFHRGLTVDPPGRGSGQVVKILRSQHSKSTILVRLEKRVANVNIFSIHNKSAKI